MMSHIGWLAKNSKGHCRLMTDLEIAASKGEYVGQFKLVQKPDSLLPDSVLLEWAKRHDVNGGLTELREMVDDARTLHLV